MSQDPGQTRRVEARWPGWLLRGVLWLWLLCTPLIAAAQPADPATIEQASRHFDRGVALVQEGSYEQAVIEFERAHALSGLATVLFNLGMAYVAVGRPVEASDALTRYLAQEGQTLTEGERVRVELELERQRQRLGILELDVQPEAAHVAIDGRPLSVSQRSGPIRVTLGEHWIEVSEQGYEASLTTFTVTPTPQRLAIRLVALLARGTARFDLRARAKPRFDRSAPQDSPVSSVTTAPNHDTLRQDERPAPRPLYRTAGYGLGILGAAAEIAALTVYLISDARYGQWKKEDHRLLAMQEALNETGVGDVAAMNVRRDANDSRLRSIRDLDKATMGLAIGGAALLVAGVAIVWTSRSRERSDKVRSNKLVLRATGLSLLREF